MSIEQRGVALNQLQRLFQVGTASGLSEWQLLRRYLTRQDGAAFETLVARHGPMVLGVCRRMLSNPDDVDDAFQATFLVLVRRAGSLSERDAIGPWLYGVASKVALRARCEAARRRTVEQSIAEEASVGNDDPIRRELGPILDEELNRLPVKYRMPVVLCYIEGETHEGAARLLGWPLGTVKGRLVRARELLKGRLVRRGLTLSGGSLVASLSREAAASVPESLLAITVRAAFRAADGRSALGAFSTPVMTLANGVLRTMIAAKLKSTGFALAVFAVLALSAGAVARRGAGNLPREFPLVLNTPLQAPSGEAVGGSPAPPRPPLPMPREVEDPQAAVGMLSKVFGEAITAYREGKVDVDKVYLWSLRIVAVEDSRGGIAARVAAYKAHLERMGDLRHHARLRAAKGKELGVNVSTAVYYYQEAAELLKAAERREPPLDQAKAPKPASEVPTALPPVPPKPIVADSATGPALSHERGKDPRSRAILSALERPIAMAFTKQTPIEDVLKFIKTATKGPDLPDGIPIYVDPIGLSGVKKTLASPVTLDLQGVPLHRTLQLILRQLGLVYDVDDGLLCITSEFSDGLLLVSPVVSSRTPLMDLQRKAARGELDAAELNELIETLKALQELDKLRRGQLVSAKPEPSETKKPAASH